MKWLLSLICISLIPGLNSDAYSQQANIWYFGFRAGLSFNTNPPTSLSDSQMDSFEGCSSICDNNGQLLFYTNGDTVWNKLHQVMANGTGLKGNSSSTNGVVIVPRPQSTTIFYIFTAGSVETNNEGYFFSEVDISLNGGLGAVTANKNVSLYGPSTERIAAVRHSNGSDVWIIGKSFGNTEWRAFKVDCNGVNTTPVISNTGHTLTIYDIYSSIGSIKCSPDGTKIALVNTYNQCWELFQFDASTGRLSNGLLFPEMPIPYGVEFSPDSKLVYVSEFFDQSGIGGSVYQFRISNYDSTAIADSRTNVGTSPGNIGGLQLGPDNKIYCALTSVKALSVINFPDLEGTPCNYSERQIVLNTGRSATGLPTFPRGPVTPQNSDFDYTIGEDCGTVHFSGNTTITGPVSWQWDFGDGTTGTGQNIGHTYAPGAMKIDTVTLTVNSLSSCITAVATKKIPLDFRKPKAGFGFENRCGSLQLDFHDSSSSESPLQNWNWDFGDGNTSVLQNPSHSFSSAANFQVKLLVQSENGCRDSISKFVVVEAMIQPSFTNTPACFGEPVQFTNTSTAPAGSVTDYVWDFGDGSSSSELSPVHTYNQDGDFIVTLKAFTTNGCVITTSKGFHISPVEAFAGNDTTVVTGQPLQLHASGGQSYQWTPPDFLSADNISDPIATLERDQQYTVKVTTQEGCIAFDEITIRVFNGPEIYVPSAFAPNGKNKIFRPILAGIPELDYFSVYDRWGQLVFTTREPGKGWDGRINGVQQQTGVFVWIVKARDYQGHTISKRGTVVLIR